MARCAVQRHLRGKGCGAARGSPRRREHSEEVANHTVLDSDENGDAPRQAARVGLLSPTVLLALTDDEVAEHHGRHYGVKWRQLCCT